MFELEKYAGLKSRHTCPACNKPKEFTRYVYIGTIDYVADHVGLCNRTGKCGYHFTPKMFFEQTGERMPAFIPQVKITAKGLFTIPVERMEATLTNYTNNSFANCLVNFFGEQITCDLLSKYCCIGTSKRYPEAVIFWQQDQMGQVRTGKIMKYGETFHRVKTFGTKWTHYGLIPDGQELRQCLFGLNLIHNYPEKPIAICEAEKTAVICSHFFPEYNWLATGSINNLSENKLQPLTGKKIILFPDLGMGFNDWTKKADTFKYSFDIQVSKYLEQNATSEQKKNGLDLADFLLITNG